MNKLMFKRYYWLVVLMILLLVVAVIFSGTRIISYNFGDYEVKSKGIGYNYENDILLLDDSLVHEISIDITQEQYDYIVNAYKDDGTKEWVKVNITIDGTTISNVGLRLKGNLTLRQALGGGNMKGGPEGGMGFGDRQGNNEFEQNENFQSEREKILEENGITMETGELPGFLVRFDKYNEGQTYQGLDRIALRIGSDSALLNEPLSYALFKEMGLVAPEVSYGDVSLGEIGERLYVISEVLGDYYVEKYFPNTDGVLYKAGNSVGFHYEGEDPTLYTDKFELVSNENKYDLSLLIKLLKFATNSTDEEFALHLEKYVDIESLVGLMVMDELVGNSDSFSGMGSNFYVYINASTGIAYFLPWDYNLSFGGMGGMGGKTSPLTPLQIGEGEHQSGTGEVNMLNFETSSQPEKPHPNLPPSQGEGVEQTGTGNIQNFPGMGGNGRDRGQMGGMQMGGGRERPEGMGGGGGGMGRNMTNDLKTKFMANEEFLALYNKTLEEWREKIYSTDLAESILDYYVGVFQSYENHSNLIPDETYEKSVEKMRNYIEGKREK